MTSSTSRPTSTGTADQKRSWDGLLAALGLKGKLPDNLTETVIERSRSKALGFRYALRDGKVDGLALRVGAEGGHGVWWLQYRTREGRRYLFKIGDETTTSLEEARKEARRVLADVRDGGNPAEARRAARAAVEAAQAKVTLRAFISDEEGREGDYWRKKLALRKEGAADKLRITHVWAPLLDKPLEAIARNDIEDILAERRAAGLSASTLRREWTCLRNALALAFKWKLLDALPVAGLPEPLVGFKPEPRLRYVGQRGDDERERLLAALAKREAVMGAEDDARMLVFAAKLAWATGMRRSEILGLRDSEIGAAAVVIPGHRTKKGRERRVRLNDAAREALALWKLRSPAGEFFPGHQDDRGWPGPAFAMWCGRLDRAWQALLADARIEARGRGGLHLHDLRHSFATQLRRAGVALEVVRDALGHADLHSTQIYAHVGEDEVAAAVEKVKLS